LLQLQQFFGGIGSINKDKKNKALRYHIAGIKDLTNILIPHFEKYPLLTKKVEDFILFQKVVVLMLNKKHLTSEGLQEIINIKASMNLGLSDLQNSEFSNLTPVVRPNINTINIPDPNWISGFVEAEGNFDVNIHKSKTNKIGYQVQLRFRIYQHERDIKLIKILIKYLGSGKIEKDTRNPVVCLTIYRISDIINKIIPFFSKNPIIGAKLLDFLD
jgi:hypothetical protein